MKKLLNKCELEIYCEFHNGYGVSHSDGSFVNRIVDSSVKVYKGGTFYEHGFSSDHKSYYLPLKVWDTIRREVTGDDND